MINFGRYRQRVTFSRIKHIKNEFFEDVVTLDDVLTRRARVTNKSYSTTKDKQPIAKKVIEIRIRYTDEVTDDMLVKFNNEQFEIDSVVDFDYSKKELVIVASCNE